MIELRLLGPVDLVVDGRSTPTPAAGERALLACLGLQAGHLVTSDRLIDAFWADDPPQHATNALQSRISRLRRALLRAGADPVVLSSRDGAYRLDLPAAHVDVLQCEELLGRARTAADARTAVALYDQALSLWRGRPLADVPAAEWVDVEVARLDELRLSAEEERLERQLVLGVSGDAVARLQALVSENPLREGLHRLLLLALYRAGRQAEALSAYHALRHRLVDELGIDPAPEVQAVAEAILRQDPSLQGDVAGAGPQGAPRWTALPTRLTSLIGREEEVQRVLELIVRHRLVTLTGPGGVGKTSLALEVVRRSSGSFGDRVAVVQLAGVDAGERLADAAASQLGLEIDPQSAATAHDALLQAFTGSHALLLLDNCEHVVDAAAGFVEALLSQCPGLSVLATSREPLAVTGEVQLAVPPLDVPVEVTDLEAMRDVAAVRLFADRASAALPDFRLTTANLPAVAEICRQLDGIPLALELAAARVKALPPKEISALLVDRFRFLTGGSRTADERQRTLRATVDWSHRSLSEPEQVLFRRLSVFRGGWTLAAAEAVCSAPPLAEADVLDVLMRLVDRSLVIADGGSVGRFRMLVTLRQYADERLVEAGESEDVQQRHAAHVLALAEAADAAMRTPAYTEASAALRVEHDNVRAALDGCLARMDVDPDSGLRLGTHLAWFWYYGSAREEGVAYLTALLDAGTGAAYHRARVMQALGLVVLQYPTARSLEAAEQSVQILDELGEARDAAASRLLVAYGGVSGAGSIGHLRELLQQARAVFDAEGDTWFHANTFMLDMQLHLRQSEYDAAAEAGDQALELMHQIGDDVAVSGVLCHLAVAQRMSGRATAAQRSAQDALAAALRAGMPHSEALAIVQLGHCSVDAGDDERAATLFVRAGEMAAALNNPRALGWAALGRARLAERQGRLEACREASREAAARLTGLEYPWVVAWAWQLLADSSAVCGDEDEANRARAMANAARAAVMPPAMAD